MPKLMAAVSIKPKIQTRVCWTPRPALLKNANLQDKNSFFLFQDTITLVKNRFENLELVERLRLGQWCDWERFQIPARRRSVWARERRETEAVVSQGQLSVWERVGAVTVSSPRAHTVGVCNTFILVISVFSLDPRAGPSCQEDVFGNGKEGASHPGKGKSYWLAAGRTQNAK